MKSIFLAATFIICVLADADQPSEDDYLNQIKSNCALDFDISNEILTLIQTNVSNIPENSNTQGYVHCILTKTGVYDPVNGFNVEQMQKIFGGNVIWFYELCKKDQGDLTPEAWCFDIATCVMGHMTKAKFN